MHDAPSDPWKVPEPAWPADGTPREKLRYLLRWAILAPSSHNTQPWLFRLDGDTVVLRPDLRRSLAVIDPEDRELVMSCGAALFHLRTALRRFGHEGEIRTLTGEAESYPLAPIRSVDRELARLRLGSEHEPTEEERQLFEAIPRRRTNRRPFEDRDVPEEVLEALGEAARMEGAWLEIVTGEDRRAALADLITEGDRRQASDPSFRRELAAWIHPSRTSSRDGMPGYALDVGDVASYLGPFLVRTFDWGDRRAAQDRELAEGSPVLAVLGTARDDVSAWLHAGEALDRVLLRATVEGLSASFLNQPVEVPELRPRVRELIERPCAPQLVLRMGYGPEVERPTPRRPVEEILVEDA